MDSRICVYCGSSNIKKGINIAMSAEVSKIEDSLFLEPWSHYMQIYVQTVVV